MERLCLSLICVPPDAFATEWIQCHCALVSLSTCWSSSCLFHWKLELSHGLHVSNGKSRYVSRALYLPLLVRNSRIATTISHPYSELVLTECCQYVWRWQHFQLQTNIIWPKFVERRQVSLTCLLWKLGYKSRARFCPRIRGKEDKREQMGPVWKWDKELAKRQEMEGSVKFPFLLCEKISNVIGCEKETGGK